MSAPRVPLGRDVHPHGVRQGVAYASSGTYVNFMSEDESDRVARAYGSNYARLAEVKAKYDPDNVFHIDQNIAPATAKQAA